jgi:hypothetical protein
MGEASERSIQKNGGVFRAISNADCDHTSRRSRAPGYDDRKFASQCEPGLVDNPNRVFGKIA